MAGGGNGQGPDVTVKVDGTMATMSNGIVSIVIDTADARLYSIAYTYNNNGSERTSDIIPKGSPGREKYYFGGFNLGSGHYDYSLATDPASNGGNYADVELLSTSDHGVMEAHYCMLRGSPGFYTVAIHVHRREDPATGFGVFGLNSVAGPLFNWVSADAARNYFVGEHTQKETTVPVPSASHEMKIDLDGGEAGQYSDKFITAQDHGDQRAWGWSSVGPTGSNIGAWTMTNMDYSDGGPLKRDVGAYPAGYGFVNEIMTGELNQGGDGNLVAGEEWTKVSGPWFVYLNNVPSTVTDPQQAAQALFQDALAQNEAEKAAWPYRWFVNPNYVPASGRGMVKGRIAIHDPNGAANPTLAGTWVGLEAQPQSTKGIFDFQKWQKSYQYWTQADAEGNFTIPNVIAGSNYTLYAFGPGAAGLFISQNQTGGNPPLELDLASPTFNVSVTGGVTTDLGTVNWTPYRLGPTVFELGYPNRKADKYRHGEDFWAGQTPPKVGYPTGAWGGEMYYPQEFPNGVSYTVGQSRWAIDWNYILPTLQDTASVYHPSSGTITFNLASAPPAGAQASIYLGCAGDSGGNIVVSVNNQNLGTVAGASATPNALTEAGFNPPATYGDDSSVHCSNHGPFFDERYTFPGSLLHSGVNTITINNNTSGFANYLMVDYLRLELTGYVPPPPASVTTFPGNNCNLVTWPVVPGAIQYALWRTTTPGTGYVPLEKGIVGQVSGSGPSIQTYTDTTAKNGTAYFYVVQSLNAKGASAYSPPSPGATPLATLPATVPAAPAGLAVTSSGDHKVVLGWSAVPAANFYSVWRTTLSPNGVGGANALRTDLLTDSAINPVFTDTTPTNGTLYSYAVKATDAAGTSTVSASVTAKPMPPPPASAPDSLTASPAHVKGVAAVKLSWTPVPGATGYAIYRSTSPDGPFAFPDNFVNGTGSASYIDKGITAGTPYYYQVTAVNAAGISPAAVVAVP
jgi:hypothetical protein